MKARALISLTVLALACGSKNDDAGHAAGGKGSGATGSGATGGTTIVTVTGGTSGTSGTSASGGSANGGSTDPKQTAADLRANACNGWSSEPEILPVVLMLVVNNSFSMNDRPGNAQSGGTKWEITRDALATAIDGMPATAAVGVLYFPNMNTQPNPMDMLDNPRDVTACVATDKMIPIDLLGATGSGQRNTIQRSLDDTSPNGSTPTHDAYDYALVRGMDASKLTGNRFMLLITDGAPTFKKNCEGGGLPNTPQPTQPIIDEVLSARQAGVRSFIIGSPGSESVNGTDVRPWMSEAAVLGATARSGCSLYGPDYCHIDLSQDANFAGALNAALARILGLITSCTFDVPATGKNGETVNPAQVNVIYTPGNGSDEQLIGRDDGADCQDGWQFDADGRVVLCPNTCFVAQNDPQGTIELLFGCDSVDSGNVR